MTGTGTPEDAARRPTGLSGARTHVSTGVFGHGLAHEGAPYTASRCQVGECATYFGTKRILTYGGGTSGYGHGRCACGWTGEHADSAAQRRREHNAHKAEVTSETGTSTTTEQHPDQEEHVADQLNTDIDPGEEITYRHDEYGQLIASNREPDGDDPYNDPDRLTPRQHDWEEKGGPLSKAKRLATEKRENARPYKDPLEVSSGAKPDDLKVEDPKADDEDIVDPTGTSDPGEPATVEQRSENPTESDKVK